MLRILLFGEKVDQINFLKSLPPPLNFSFVFERKKKKCLELSDLARKLIRIFFWKSYPPPEFLGFFVEKKLLGEMFEVNSADTCAENLCLCRWGAEWRVSRAQNRERGPPSALAEILIFSYAV